MTAPESRNADRSRHLPVAASLRAGAFTTAASDHTEQSAEDIARRVYGLEARARRLGSERDQNFHLGTAAGAAYVLKIGNPSEDPAIAVYQTDVLRHIATAASGLPVPRVIPTVDGRHHIELPASGGRSSIGRLMSYLEGTPLVDVDPVSVQRHALGAALAHLSLALGSFSAPAPHNPLLWDVSLATQIRPILGSIRPGERRRLATRFLDGFEMHALPRLPELRRQVIHNDFNPHNVLVDPVRPDRVAGIIDFGDIVEATLAQEIATACSYHVTGEPGAHDLLDGAIALTAGYDAILPLTADEISLIYDLMAMRMVLTVAITAWRAELHPENSTYILRNNPRAWRGLEGLARLSRGAVHDAFRTGLDAERR